MKVQIWEDDAPCREIGPEIFHPKGRGPALAAAVRTAKDVCRRRCPVREQCLALALALEGTADRYSRNGIWGGLTAQERAALRGAA